MSNLFVLVVVGGEPLKLKKKNILREALHIKVCEPPS
jgi:hypothetical protein